VPPSEKAASTPKKSEEVPQLAAPPLTSAATEKPDAVEVVPATPKTVTVQAGDTLSRIAERIYGHPKYWRLIYEANRQQIDTPDKIRVGMKLTLPPASRNE